jgi:Dyp-type peroxidase family
MPPIFPLAETNVDYHDPKFTAVFTSLQGNILKGHGRDHTTHIFVQFKPGNKKKVADWISGFAESAVTPMIQQLIETERFKASKEEIPGDLFASLYLSSTGYDYLGLDKTKLDAVFAGGMKGANTRLHDTPESFWENGFHGHVDMMILLADDDRVRMAATGKQLLEELPDIATIKTVEYGHAIRDANGIGLEHNGYADGISQPLFLSGDIDDFKRHNPGLTIYDPTAPLGLVLEKDPFGPNAEDFGSYFVFRKLEQNPRGFKNEEEIELVEKLKTAAATVGLHFGVEDEERAGAMVVGRYEDGSPLTASKFNNLPDAANFNNFNYDQDAQGAKCPFHAHIRKSNPRRAGDKDHVMARRGIPFGQRDVPTESDPSAPQSPTSGVGLLFMSYQQSLGNQFEFIQMNWVNNANFPSAGAGADPVIGEDPSGLPAGFKSTGKYPMEYNNASPANLSQQTVDNFVKLRGGEYFFAPSIAFLKNLGS